MTRDEAVKMLQATRLMLMDGANQPISDLYYALDMAIEALEQTEPNCSEKPNNCEVSEIPTGSIISKMEQVDEPERNMAEDIVESFGFKAESYRQAKAKDEPQTCSFSDCDNFKNPDYERCIECKRKQIKLKTEQTERSE